MNKIELNKMGILQQRNQFDHVEDISVFLYFKDNEKDI